MNSLSNSELMMDFEDFPGGEINLESEGVREAIELGNKQITEPKKWRGYLNALAVFAFEEWLKKREPNISVLRTDCSVFKPEYANLIPVVANLAAGNFKISLIVAGIVCESVIVPRAVIDLPEFAPHFYVLLEVEEELEIASIRGFLRYDELAKLRQKLVPKADWSYQLSTAWFNPNPDDLLLYLRCLEPEAILLPEVANDSGEIFSKVEAKLKDLLPRFQTGELWEFLSWEEGVAVLTSPDLVNSIYRLQKGEIENANTYLSDLLELLTRQAVNVVNWADNKIDEVGKKLSWQLLPASNLRQKIEKQPMAELDEILKSIQRGKKTTIPDNAGRGYREFSVAETTVRLYAVSWSISEEEKEWSLLLVLSAVGGGELPSGIKLRASDRQEILTEKTPVPNSKNPYPFIRLIGSWDEKFVATVATADEGEKISTVFEWKG